MRLAELLQRRGKAGLGRILAGLTLNSHRFLHTPEHTSFPYTVLNWWMLNDGVLKRKQAHSFVALF